MVNEHGQAISTANHYFLLVDEMIPGFKDHLANHVVLKWFGKVIKGRENVTAFMLSNKTKTFHTFSDITPISEIPCKSKQSNRRIKRSLDQNGETYTSNSLHVALSRSSHETDMSTTYVKDWDQESNVNDAAFIDEAACNGQNVKTHKVALHHGYEVQAKQYIDKLRISTDVNVNSDLNQNKFSANAIFEMDDQSYNLNKNDRYNIFEPEITSQPIVEKIQNINRIKLKEEMAPTIRAINRECDQGDGPVTAEASTTKYLEANGEIKFVRTNIQTDSLFLYHWSKLCKKKTWKQQCKLQITYSLLNDSKVVKKCCSSQENDRSTCVSKLSAKVHNVDKIQKSKLPSLEEAIQRSNSLIRDVNNFGGYLQPLNFWEDREHFLKLFETEVTEKNPNTRFCLHYVDNKLIFDFPNKKPFSVMYQIHEIIYSKVKVNSNTQEAAGAK